VTIGAESVIWARSSRLSLQGGGVGRSDPREPDLGVARDHAPVRSSGVLGLVNVDLTPEVAVRLANSRGHSTQAGARRGHEPQAPSACRMIKAWHDPPGSLRPASTSPICACCRPLSTGHLPQSRELRARHPHRCSGADPEVIRSVSSSHPEVKTGASILQKEMRSTSSASSIRRTAGRKGAGRIAYPAPPPGRAMRRTARFDRRRAGAGGAASGW